uniref:Fibroblast growth factor n=1 Tax=Paramormyrops kingsleyae TaxID=1676925 RepID=A0A3B3RF21_9TELE
GIYKKKICGGCFSFFHHSQYVPPTGTSHPFRGLAQKQLLYCRVGIGYHLQILPNGNIGGVHEPTEYCRFCWLKVFSMQWGVVGIKGLKSNLYLCMSSAGIAWGSEHFMAECLFREDMEEDHYTTYASASHPGLYLALSHNGQAKRGNTVQKENPCAHFLPQVKDPQAFPEYLPTAHTRFCCPHLLSSV